MSELDTAPAEPDMFHAIFGIFPQDTHLISGGKDFEQVKSNAELWVKNNAQSWASDMGYKLEQCHMIICLQLSVAEFKENSIYSPAPMKLVLPQ